MSVGGDLSFQSLSQPKVKDLDLAFRGNLDVGGFQVTVDDPLLVGLLHSLCDLKGNLEGFLNRNGTLGDPVCQCWAFDQLQHQCLGSPSILNAVDLTDIGVTEGSKNLSFPLEPPHPLAVRGKPLGQDLQSHVPVQLGIGGPVHHTHTAFADLLQNLVMANGRSDHTTPPHAMQLGAMLRREAAKDNEEEQNGSSIAGTTQIYGGRLPTIRALSGSPPGGIAVEKVDLPGEETVAARLNRIPKVHVGLFLEPVGGPQG